MKNLILQPKYSNIMSNNENKKVAEIINLDFVDVNPRKLKEDKRSGFVSYGEKDEYPDYLLDLMDHSADHGAIIRGKADFVIGGGIEVASPEVDQKTGFPKEYPFLKSVNKDGESIEEVFKKIEIDVEIFGGAIAECIYSRAGKLVGINHLEFQKCRLHKDGTKLKYAAEGWAEKSSSGEWITKVRPEFKSIESYDAQKKQARCFVYIRQYSPGAEAYPKPEYIGALRAIATDCAISEFHLNGITNGMFTSKMISFNNGVPETEDEKKEIEKKINNKHAGPKNAGRVMVAFSRSGENAPTVIDLSGTEIDKHFDTLSKKVQQSIYSGHRITSPMIFGIKTEGQLGGRTELREAYELLNATYLQPRREFLEKYLNLILPDAGIPRVKIRRTELISHEFDAATMADNMTEDEIRASMGLAPRDESTGLKGQSKIIKRLAALPALVANKVLDMLTPNEVRSIIGLPGLAGGDNVEGQTDPATVQPAPAPVVTPTPIAQAKKDDLNDEEDAKVFSEFGSSRDAFTIYESRKILFDDSLKASEAYFAEVKNLKGNKLAVLSLLEKDPKIDSKAIAEALDIAPGRAEAILADLQESKLLKITTEKIGEDEVTVRTPNADARDIIDNGSNSTTSIKVLYSYEGPKDPRNRPFCAKLLELNRVYSRTEIESISERLGYSIWDRRGGWYKPEGSTEARPYCRHSWFANVVIDKKSK